MFYLGKCIQIAISRYTKNQGQTNPPLIEIYLQTANFRLLEHSKILQLPYKEQSRLAGNPDHQRDQTSETLGSVL